MSIIAHVRVSKHKVGPGLPSQALQAQLAAMGPTDPRLGP